MCELIKYIFGEFIRPFHDTRFRIVFTIFIFSSLFGVYYKAINPINNLSFFDTFTPEALFTYTVPLLATAIMDGILKTFSYHEELVNRNANHKDFVTSVIFSFLILLIMFVVIAVSLWWSNLFLAIVGALFSIVMWVFVNSSNFTSQITTTFDPTGDEEPSANNLQNGG
ncbi:hypothetical protein PDY_22450 [Photobacterium damselae subsp. damselae]|uniref:hypothetical protein n=1 Tax=Photobacterium damselae TaxID=38293 RepID=UPI001EFD8E08|nr:hypothetical protein [Photobacterium damselae]MCG9706984.1 hypothetical protein [Photobacterium damselae]BDR35197.1 hypothetical protein PDY_22450 [Photobacterium damselae subsp. damselae]